MTVFIDVHEPKEIGDYLIKWHVPVEHKALEVADVVIGKQVIERKSMKEFFIDKHSGRLGVQVRNMTAQYERPMLIIEGKLPSYEFNPKERMELFSYIALSKNLQVILTEELKDTARCLLAIYNATTDRVPEFKPRLFGRHPEAPKEIIVQILRCFKGIGPKKAEELLNHFTLYELFGASEEQINAILKNKKAIKRLKMVFNKDKTGQGGEIS
jgi:ERCC4-type nuclease